MCSVNVILHFFLFGLLSLMSFSLATLTSFSSMPMNVLVIRLVTVLLIDSSFTSLRILSLYAFSFTVLSASSKFSVKSRRMYKGALDFPEWIQNMARARTCGIFASVRPPVEQRGPYRWFKSSRFLLRTVKRWTCRFIF